MRLVHALNALLLAVQAAVLAIYWPKLPDSIPIHFGLDGLPNRWAPKTGAFEVIAIVPWALVVLFYLLAAGLRTGRIKSKHEGSIPPEKRAEFAAFQGDLLFILTASTNLMLTVVVVSVVAVALKWVNEFPAWAFWPALTVVTLTAGAGAVKTMRVLERFREN